MVRLVMKYFVLNPSKQDDYGRASRKAMLAYAEEICKENSELSNDLIEWIKKLEVIDNTSFKEEERLKKAARAFD